MSFDVIDPKTGRYPDLEKIVRTEDWAEGLCYCDMDGFAISEDGSLILMDECGNQRICPSNRFIVKWTRAEDLIYPEVQMFYGPQDYYDADRRTNKDES